METKHTPGPYRIVINCSVDYELRPYLVYSGVRPIAEVNREDDGSDEANARLISAAPDLFAALESAAESIEQLVRIGRIPANNAGLRDARAALARARGEG